MKKIVSVILAVFMMVTMLAGCGGEKSPTDVVKEKIDSYKANAESLFKGERDSNSQLADASGLGEDVEKKIIDLIAGFEYTVDHETIDGDQATVDVTIKTCELGDMFKTAMGNYIAQAFGLALAGASDEELEEKALEAFTTAIDEMSTEKSYEKKLKVNLTHGDDGWKVEDLDNNKHFLNAVTGGLVGAINDMDNWFQDEK